MGLGKLFTRNVNYQVTDTATGVTELFTVHTDGAGVYPGWSQGAYGGAMSIPGVARAATLLADLLGGLPWHALRERAGRPVETVSAPLLDQPNPPDPRIVTFSSLALDLIMNGNAVAVIATRGMDGWPTTMIPVPADTVQIRRTEAGTVQYLIGRTTYSADDVVHIKGLCEPGALRGMSVLENHFNSLELAHEQNRQARSLSRHGVPTGVLTSENPDLTQGDADALKNAWLRSQRDRTVAVLNKHTSFQALSWNPTELQLLEARTFQLHELALIFGLPLSFLGADQSSRTYSNIEQESLNLIRYSLSGHLARFEQTLALQFPRGTWVKANLDGILRADTLTRYQAHAVALTNGFLTTDEVRELEDRPPLTPDQLALIRPQNTPPQDGVQE